MSEEAKVIVFDPTAGMDLQSGAVDAQAGTIKGVSIATAGVTAEGHHMTIVDENDTVLEVREWVTDADTLSTMLDAILAIGEPLKAKLEHGSGLSEIVGTFDNFRIDGAHLRADFEAIQTAAGAEHLLNLAAKVSKQFGVSVTAKLNRVKAGAVDLMRAVKVMSADFVDSPAINAGLFSSKSVVDKQLQKDLDTNRIHSTNTHMEDTLKTEIGEMISGAIDEKLASYDEKMSTLTSRLETLEKPADEMTEGQKEEMQAAIKAEVTELSKKFDTDSAAIKTELSEKFTTETTELKSKLASAEQLSKALGIKVGAKVSDSATPDAKEFRTELSAKIASGKNYVTAIHELNAEQPEVVKAELSKRGITNINLL